MINILLLGSSGFIGKNLEEGMRDIFNIVCTQRKEANLSFVNTIYFDLEKKDTWINLLSNNYDIVINALAYGVIKTESEPNKLLDINYILLIELREYLIANNPEIFWIQIGTAFEYSLTQERITENSKTLPLTFYGITKFLFSNYLQNSENNNFLILRPFAMFGKYENASKIFPALILSQKHKTEIKLSHGLQERDYFPVEDLVSFVILIIKSDVSKFKNEVINVGSGVSVSLKCIAEHIEKECPTFSKDLWKWGLMESRIGESNKFYNGSDKCYKLGFKSTSLNLALKKSVKYYWNEKQNGI